MSCEFTVAMSEFDDVIEGFNLDFGHVKHITKRQSTSSQPPSPSSTFDAVLDDKLGYVSWTPENFAADLHQFAEGLQDTNINNYQDNNADASGLWDLGTGTIKVGNKLEVSKDDFYLEFGKRSPLARRSIFSTLSGIAAQVGSAVADKAVSLAKTAVATIASGFVDVLAYDLSGLTSYIDGSPKSFTRDYSYTFPPDDDKRFVDQSTFLDSAGQPRKAIQLYEKKSKDGNGKITLYCLDCGVSASVEITGTLAYKLGSGIQQASLIIDGEAMASAYLGLDATYNVQDSSTQRVFEEPIEGLIVPGFLDLGPIVTLDVETSYFLSASAGISAGATIKLSGLHSVIDLIHPENDIRPNINFNVNPSFTATGQVSAGVGMGLPLGVSVGVSVANGKAKADGTLIVEPLLNVTASASVSINAGTSGASACGVLTHDRSFR